MNRLFFLICYGIKVKEFKPLNDDGKDYFAIYLNCCRQGDLIQIFIGIRQK